MNENVCANVNLYRRGRLQQGYSLNGDRVSVTLRAYGFSIFVEMEEKNNEGRPQASVRVCGHTIFDTEDHALEAPEVVGVSLPAFAPGILREAEASVAFDGQTQLEHNMEG